MSTSPSFGVGSGINLTCVEVARNMEDTLQGLRSKRLDAGFIFVGELNGKHFDSITYFVVKTRCFLGMKWPGGTRRSSEGIAARQRRLWSWSGEEKAPCFSVYEASGMLESWMIRIPFCMDCSMMCLNSSANVAFFWAQVEVHELHSPDIPFRLSLLYMSRGREQPSLCW